MHCRLTQQHAQVVDSESAKIEHANGEYGVIFADYRNMTEVTSPDDIGFKRVSAQSCRWLNDFTSLLGI